MAAVRTTLVKHKVYSNDMPWQLQAVAPGAAALHTHNSRSIDMRLVRYLTKGATRDSERTRAAYEASRRQTHFLFFAAMTAVVWTIFLIV